MTLHMNNRPDIKTRQQHHHLGQDCSCLPVRVFTLCCKPQQLPDVSQVGLHCAVFHSQDGRQYSTHGHKLTLPQLTGPCKTVLPYCHSSMHFCFLLVERSTTALLFYGQDLCFPLKRGDVFAKNTYIKTLGWLKVLFRLLQVAAISLVTGHHWTVHQLKAKWYSD